MPDPNISLRGIVNRGALIGDFMDKSPSFESPGGHAYQRGYRWVMLVLLWLLYGAFGAIQRSIFPLITPILEDLHMSYSQMGLILGSWQLTYILAALVAGPILDRWGVHKSILAGAVIMGLSAALRCVPEGFGAMLAAVAMFGAGGPMISIGGPKTISEWFIGKSRGTAVGIYMTGPWIGGLLALSLTNSLVMPFIGNSWRLTFVCYGLLTFGVALLWAVLGKGKQPEMAAQDIALSEVLGELIRRRNVQILLLMGLFSFAVGHGFSSWLPQILEHAGLSSSNAGFAASIPLLTGIPGILLFPRLVPSHLRGRFIALLGLLTAVHLLLVVSLSGALLVAALALLGLVSSSFMPLMILMLMDNTGVEPRYMGAAGGVFFCVAEIGGFSGPLLMGTLVDLTGTFVMGAIFLAALSMAILAMTFLLETGPPSGSVVRQ
jgi:CP family cyanate transporter-like MFS transporter